MARGRKRGAVTATMEEQIQKAQEKVIKTKTAYDAAVESLQKLLDKRDAQRKDELWNAIIKSSITDQHEKYFLWTKSATVRYRYLPL